ncbi:hypothetical protein [Actinomadura sp. WAC 06369]|uniref:hypothetical protein n=1 Tax=Actinomadura sp. WAC 06369 TaxID=2203193 RepID=UPI000F767555|nr:hypothetical protein [Actinomadura sp. WAC 06369]RSN67404.1 hypothetical protein DMH08_13425 [Actinomadura sp. WAC 06369]
MRFPSSAAFVVAAFCAWAFYPAVLAYTFAAGENATATVVRCDLNNRAPDECHGTWRTEDGETGRGEIYNLDADTAEGRTFPVRIGPLGPYANGWGRTWWLPVFWGAALLVMLGVPARVVRRRTFRTGRRTAAGLPADPGALVVSEGGTRHPDGSTHTVVRNLRKAPPGHRRLDLPGRTPRHGEWAGGMKSRFTFFETLLGADQQPLMQLEHRSEMSFEPETVLLDTSGIPRLLIRREAGSLFWVLAPDGRTLGSARPEAPATDLAVRDAEGRMVARCAERGPGECVLRIEQDAPMELRNAALVLALVRTRRRY